MKVLKTGDLCPCCGHPIQWKHPRILQLLTYAVDGELTTAGMTEMINLMEEEKRSEQQ